MKKIGLFYSFNSKKTARIAGIIHNNFTSDDVQDVNVDDINKGNFPDFDNMILGVPTWFDGELPNYWDELMPALEEIDFSAKKIAIFGLGDQKGYPENFCDAIGIMALFFEEKGAQIVGKQPLTSYTFEASKAVRNNEFLGLPLDQENQSRLTASRIESWVAILKNEFN